MQTIRLANCAANFLRDAHALRRESERSQAMFWSRRVNRPLGAIIAQALLRTRVTPNSVSIAGAITHMMGAALVLTTSVPAPIPVAVAVFVVWQFGLALDNTDGLLARARGSSSPFGAWLDQILDLVTHTAVVGSSVVFVVRALHIPAAVAAGFATLVVESSILGIFVSAQRNALLGTRPAREKTAADPLRIPFPFMARHLTDFGAFLAAASIGLVWPPAMLVVLVFSSVLVSGSVAAQVAINWPSGSRRPVSRRLGDP